MKQVEFMEIIFQLHFIKLDNIFSVEAVDYRLELDWGYKDRKNMTEVSIDQYTY